MAPILILDDDPGVLEVMNDVFINEGYAVKATGESYDILNEINTFFRLKLY